MLNTQQTGEFLNYRFYHGTSGHYRQSFILGCAPAPWPHKESALRLLCHVWTELRAVGQEPEWYVDYVMQQVGGRSNWQHGELYLTLSRRKAVEYARGGARNGGELLGLCKDGLDLLDKIDSSKAAQLIKESGTLATYLQSNRQQPLVIEIGNIGIEDIAPERDIDDVTRLLARYASQDDEKMRDIMGQGSNFRLSQGAGIVKRVFEVEGGSDTDPLSPFCLVELRESTA